jgi:hypothetical protein
MNDEQTLPNRLRISEILYLSLVALSYYLLLSSRTGEARTIWEFLHPAFIPILLIATCLLVAILFSSEKTVVKLLFTIVVSVLLHSFFSIIFPAGDTSGQQMALGRIRLVFDSVTALGSNPYARTVQELIYELFRGIHFQAATSVIFARMLSLDIFWVHLNFIPVLWGVFVPVASFLITRTLGGNNRISVLSSLLVSVFPYPTYFGAISVPNSLGFIFFLFSLYFILRNLESDDSKTTFLMLAFSFLAFLSHYLTGIMSASLILLALAFKSYAKEEKTPSAAAKSLLAIAFIVSAALLPLSLIYLRLFDPTFNAAFTLNTVQELPLSEIIGLFTLGQLVYGFDLKTVFLIIIGSAIGFLWMIYQLYRLKRTPTTKYRLHVYFLFAAFLVVLIDYRILKLFMSRLPLNEERLWVFRDFIAAPFASLAIYSIALRIKASLKAKSPQKITVANLKTLSKLNALRMMALLLTINAIIPFALGGWITFSLQAAYPNFAPLQTTWYELEAVKYIDKNTKQKYVVIGDIWTTYAGEMIVGINNPRAYYFAEFSKTRNDLFANMSRQPSPQWMLSAMNYTDTTIAYFIISEPRLGTEEYNNVISRVSQNEQLTLAGVFGGGKLYIFSYKKEQVNKS